MKTPQKTEPKTNHAAVLVAAAFMLGTATAWGAVGTDYLTDPSLMVKVGDARNDPDDTTGYGAVNYEYYIGKYTVTNAQYVAFLNAVDSTGANTLGLYNNGSTYSENALATYNTLCGIIWNNDAGRYELKSANYAAKPVIYVNFWDAVRFTNWLTNGATAGASTETGVYILTPDGISANSITRNVDAWEAGGFAIASEDEWYKAAYYNGNVTNTYRTYPVTDELSQRIANIRNGNGEFAMPGDTYIADVDYYDAQTGASSFYETYQQGGNVFEWTESIVDTTARAERGASFYDYGSSLASSVRNKSLPSIEGSNIGFRVVTLSLATVPEPGTWAAAMGLAVFAFGVWVRRGRV
jgi:formylglycine-generating enzyme required for sulfatase activity